ncbi:MAG: galactokinase family protein, partial [Planctomycetes bacterium]|nr:galactokinase family protein [Planctomycetota bacterium]
MLDLTALAADLSGGKIDSRLDRLYGDSPGGVGAGRERLERLVGDFTKRFGPAGPAALFSTPGRTEIGGNHTDHQTGCVLAGSVNLDIIAVARPNGLEEVRLESDGYPGSGISLKNLAPAPADFSASRALGRGI